MKQSTAPRSSTAVPAQAPRADLAGSEQATPLRPARTAKATAPAKTAHRNASPAVTDKNPDGRTEAIRQAAYAIYEARGHLDGNALDDWLRAEALVGRASAPQ